MPVSTEHDELIGHLLDVEAAAHEWSVARRRLEDADSQGHGDALVRLASASHDLALAVDGECVVCEPGSCPGCISAHRWPDSTEEPQQ